MISVRQAYEIARARSAVALKAWEDLAPHERQVIEQVASAVADGEVCAALVSIESSVGAALDKALRK